MPKPQYYQTFDRIDNLKLQIDLYRKGQHEKPLEELKIHWQQTIPKLEYSKNVGDKQKSKYLYVEVYNNDPDLMSRAASQVSNRQLYNHVINSRVFAQSSVDTLGLPSNNMNPWINSITSDIGEMNIKLQFPNTVTKQDEIVVQLRHYGNGNFSISPDFSTPESFYQLNNGDDIFEYRITNISSQPSPEFEKREESIFLEYIKRLVNSQKAKLPYSKLSVPINPFPMKMIIMGQFCQLKGFTDSTLFIQFELLKPDNWKLESESQIISKSQGYSQTVKCTLDSDTAELVGNLGMPFEFNFLIPDENDTSCKAKLYIKVMAVDSWDKQRVVGYSMLEFNFKSGPFNCNLSTWKPKLHFQSQLKSYFLGGGPELMNLKYNELDSNSANNKYGFKTESSGSIIIQYNTIIQKRSEVQIEESQTQSELFGATNSKIALDRARLRLKALRAFGTAKNIS